MEQGAYFPPCLPMLASASGLMESSSDDDQGGHLCLWFQDFISQQKEKIVLLSKCSDELSPPEQG